MTRNTLLASALFAASLIGLALLFTDSAPTDALSPADVSTSAEVGGSGSASSGGPAAGFDRGDLESHLSEWRRLHGPIGYLSQEETEMLIARREAAALALAAGIGRMSSSELESVLDAFRSADRSRDKLVMIDGLGSNPSTEALSILEEIYATEDSYTLKSSVIRALGDSPAEGHTDLLVDTMWGGDDERLQQLSAQGLYGEAGMEDALAEAIGSDLPMKVRLEAVHSLGATGSEEAKQILEEAVETTDEDRLRLYAEKEIVRSFG